jgi:hypothetical protein
VAQLKKQYPQFTFIEGKTSNHLLIQEGFDLALTVHGTLGHEFPYFGIPVLTAGDNPHANYDFCTHARTREEYESFLWDPSQVPKPSSSARDAVHEFYYMNNVHLFPGKIPKEENKFLQDTFNDTDLPGGLERFVESCKDPRFLEKLDYLISKSIQATLKL